MTTAILARTNRYLRIFEDMLSEKGVRYYLVGKSGFWQQREIKDVLAFAQIAVMPRDSSVMTALKSPFWPTRFLRKKEISDGVKSMQSGDPNKRSMLSLLSGFRTGEENQDRIIKRLVEFLTGMRRYADSPGSVVSDIIRELKAEEYYDTEESAIDNAPLENIMELRSIAAKFPSLREFMSHVDKVNAASRVKKGVALSTLHAAKGNEYDCVFLVGVQDGMLPHAIGIMEEEKRIFFVGASRAAKRLCITHVGPASCFINGFKELMVNHAVQESI